MRSPWNWWNGLDQSPNPPRRCRHNLLLERPLAANSVTHSYDDYCCVNYVSRTQSTSWGNLQSRSILLHARRHPQRHFTSVCRPICIKWSFSGWFSALTFETSTSVVAEILGFNVHYSIGVSLTCTLFGADPDNAPFISAKCNFFAQFFRTIYQAIKWTCTAIFTRYCAAAGSSTIETFVQNTKTTLKAFLRTDNRLAGRRFGAKAIRSKFHYMRPGLWQILSSSQTCRSPSGVRFFLFRIWSQTA